jgi:hypothetical protein
VGNADHHPNRHRRHQDQGAAGRLVQLAQCPRQKRREFLAGFNDINDILWLRRAISGHRWAFLQWERPMHIYKKKGRTSS